MEYYDLLVTGEAKGKVTEIGFTPFNSPVRLLPPERFMDAYDPNSIILVQASNSIEVNRKIIRSPCDGIVDPIFKRANGLDYNAYTIMKDNDIALVITLFRFLGVRGIDRARLIYRARQAVKMAIKKKVRIIITSGADHVFDTRTPYQLKNFGEFLGLTPKQAERAISTAPEYLLHRKGGAK